MQTKSGPDAKILTISLTGGGRPHGDREGAKDWYSSSVQFFNSSIFYSVTDIERTYTEVRAWSSDGQADELRTQHSCPASPHIYVHTHIVHNSPSTPAPLMR